MITPSDAQRAVRDHASPSLLILAPAGCGKTEALALRVGGLAGRSQLLPHERLLITTFTNRARENIMERLHLHLPTSLLRSRVTVCNFHGLSARIIAAHGSVLGLDKALELPDGDWVGEQCRAMRLSFDASSIVQNILRAVKQQPFNDDQVLQELRRYDNPHAVTLEELRGAEGQLTYDDLPRLAEMILANNAIARLYQNHFRFVVVDEFQDLTPQQLRIIQSIGRGRTTYAGDLAQGIYSFAGAAPEAILREIRAEVQASIITFAESHRSSPSVVAMVNGLAPAIGGQQLTSARPESWPNGGLSGRLKFDDVHAEAQWIVQFAEGVLKRAPAHRIGIISRTKSRNRFVDARLAGSGLPYYRWDDPILDSTAATIVRKAIRDTQLGKLQHADDPLAYLWSLVQSTDAQDPTTRESTLAGLAWALDLLQSGESKNTVIDRIRVGDEDTLLSASGAHLLTGHVGKGQQFDWVVIVGLEEGVLPDFRADSPAARTEEARILSVMLSRARHGVLLSTSATVPTLSGSVTFRPPSSFLQYFDVVATCRSGPDISTWLRGANWEAIAAR